MKTTITLTDQQRTELFEMLQKKMFNEEYFEVDYQINELWLTITGNIIDHGHTAYYSNSGPEWVEEDRYATYDILIVDEDGEEDYQLDKETENELSRFMEAA